MCAHENIRRPRNGDYRRHGTGAYGVDRPQSPMKWQGQCNRRHFPANSSLQTCGYSLIPGEGRWPTIPSVAPSGPIS